jgi:hypothetical protein
VLFGFDTAFFVDLTGAFLATVFFLATGFLAAGFLLAGAFLVTGILSLLWLFQ